MSCGRIWDFGGRREACLATRRMFEMRLKPSNSEIQIFPEGEDRNGQFQRAGKGPNAVRFWNFEEPPCAVSPVLRPSAHRR